MAYVFEEYRVWLEQELPEHVLWEPNSHTVTSIMPPNYIVLFGESKK